MVGEDVGGYGEAVVEERAGAEVEMGIDGAEARVGGAVNKAGNAGVDDGSGAHYAGFDGCVERRADQAIIAQGDTGGSDRENFGVGRRIAVGDGAVRRRSEQRAFGGNDARSDRDFADGGGFACRFEGDVHPMFVSSFHQRHFSDTVVIWEEDKEDGETGDRRRKTGDKRQETGDRGKRRKGETESRERRIFLHRRGERTILLGTRERQPRSTKNHRTAKVL